MRLCWPRVTLYIVFIILSSLSLLSGCGKKGPLYRPIQAPQEASTPAAPAPTPTPEPTPAPKQ